MGTVLRQLLSRGGLAALAVALAVPLSLLVPPLEQAPYALFLGAVVVSAWHGGSWASWLATALSVLALDLFFLPPIYALGHDRADSVRLAAFVVAGALVALLQASRERKEEVLRRREQRKREFMAVLAHELRNLLAPVGAAVQVLRGGTPEPAAAQCLQIVERQVHNMGRLVNDLLDAFRLEQGHLSLRREPVDLTATVAEIVKATRHVLEAHGHLLTTELPHGPLHLEVDATRLEQIVINLLMNAAKYTRRGGRINVVLREEGPEVVLRVRDTGIGIPADKLVHVFDPFVQLSNGTRDGIGVGLSLARGLARLHGGDITACSEGPGKGSEFALRLPLPEPADTVREPPQ
jgi:signal transduction histidine kinase